MDSEPVKSDAVQISVVLKQHFDAIDDMPMFKGAMKILVVENNMGNEASHMYHMVRDRPNVRAYSQKEDRMGIHKRDTTADEYQYYMNLKLRHESILFERDCFTNNKKYKINGVKGMLREQLERFHGRIEKGKVIYSGKIGSEQDDLVIATLMAVFWPQYILLNPRQIV